MINGLLLAFSITCGVTGSGFRYRIARDSLKTMGDNAAFNLILSLVCILVMAVAGGLRRPSLLTLLLSVVFGLLIILAGLSSVAAMHNGPMTLSVLISLCGTLIPTTVGSLLWREPVTPFQIAGIVLMLLSMALVLNPTVNSKITARWIAWALASFLLNGLIGLTQKIQSTSIYADEKMQFLFWSFVISALFLLGYLLAIRRARPGACVGCSFRGKLGAGAVLVGLTNAAQHIINLILVGLIPAAVFFPICNGGNILLTGLMGAVVFKERMTRWQIVGFVLGIFAILLVANVASAFS
ncbi:MAG: EamA family transporter [Oscillospiraceae bacterium]|nr:EamA family transporter [Oscillospiraceae bacterium]